MISHWNQTFILHMRAKAQRVWSFSHLYLSSFTFSLNNLEGCKAKPIYIFSLRMIIIFLNNSISWFYLWELLFKPNVNSYWLQIWLKYLMANILIVQSCLQRDICGDWTKKNVKTTILLIEIKLYCYLIPMPNKLLNVVESIQVLSTLDLKSKYH